MDPEERRTLVELFKANAPLAVVLVVLVILYLVVSQVLEILGG